MVLAGSFIAYLLRSKGTASAQLDAGGFPPEGADAQPKNAKPRRGVRARFYFSREGITLKALPLDTTLILHSKTKSKTKISFRPPAALNMREHFRAPCK